jgi:hypothetical protein
MAETILIEKAELKQIFQWLRDIDEAVDFIDKNVEEETYLCLDRCRDIRKTLNKMRGMLTVSLCFKICAYKPALLPRRRQKRSPPTLSGARSGVHG